MSKIRIQKSLLTPIIKHFGQAGSNAIYWASRHGHIETLKFLNENKCPLDVKDKVRTKFLPYFMEFGFVFFFICFHKALSSKGERSLN